MGATTAFILAIDRFEALLGDAKRPTGAAEPKQWGAIAARSCLRTPVALAILQKTLRSDHPDVANSLNNLAALYQNQGRYADAESLYKRSLAIMEKTLGPSHPDVANSLNNLAALYQQQGRYADAEPLYKQSVAILEWTLGPDHPEIAANLNNLGALYQAQGRHADAEPLYARSLMIQKKAAQSSQK